MDKSIKRGVPMNKIMLIGRLAQSPEARYTASGKAVTVFAVACNYRAGGTEITDYIDCVTWDKLAQTVATHLSKGRLVGIEGRLSVRRYTTTDGQNRKVYEVVVSALHFLDSPAATAAASASGGGAGFEELGSFVSPF